MKADPSYERIYAVVRRIPRGRVATYGQVAAVTGLPGRARQVGYALHALPHGSDVPWQRVINAKGEVSPRSEPGYENYQRHLLEEDAFPNLEHRRATGARIAASGGAGAQILRPEQRIVEVPVSLAAERARRRS